MLIFQLHGFVFFGTAQGLLDRIRSRLLDAKLKRLRYLILDFRRVSGLDSSAVSSFVKLSQIAEMNRVSIVLCFLSPDARCQLERGGLEQSKGVRILPTLDEAQEWCENQLIAAGGRAETRPSDLLETALEEILPDKKDIARLRAYMETMCVDSPRWVLRQGDLSDALYFIASGLATAELEPGDGKRIHLGTMRPGKVFGEVGLYLRVPRTASVHISEPTVLYRLSAQCIDRMQAEDPDLAAALHRWIAGLMAQRLADNNSTLGAMLD